MLQCPHSFIVVIKVCEEYHRELKVAVHDVDGLEKKLVAARRELWRVKNDLAVEKLVGGSVLLKYPTKGSAHSRLVWLDRQGCCVCWCEKLAERKVDKERTFKIAEIKELRKGGMVKVAFAR